MSLNDLVMELSRGSSHRAYQARLARYKVTLDDIERNLHAVILLSNELDGPQVLYDRERKCFGLFAQRDYRKGEVVTTYGGTIYNHECAGDYVASVSARRHIDGIYGFELQQKARWINEYDSTRAHVNVKLGLTIRTLRAVNAGEQFFTDYGNEYCRTY